MRFRRCAGCCRVEVPDPQWRIEPGAEPFPYGAVGYRRLAGVTPAPEIAERNRALLTTDLADFLSALHRVPLDLAEALGLQASLLGESFFRAVLDRYRRAHLRGSSGVPLGTEPGRGGSGAQTTPSRAGTSGDSPRSFLWGTSEAPPSGDRSLEQRARRLFELRQFGGVRLACELQDDEELTEAIARLRRSSLLAG